MRIKGSITRHSFYAYTGTTNFSDSGRMEGLVDPTTGPGKIRTPTVVILCQLRQVPLGRSFLLELFSAMYTSNFEVKTLATNRRRGRGSSSRRAPQCRRAGPRPRRGGPRPPTRDATRTPPRPARKRTPEVLCGVRVGENIIKF